MHFSTSGFATGLNQASRPAKGLKMIWNKEDHTAMQCHLAQHVRLGANELSLPEVVEASLRMNLSLASEEACHPGDDAPHLTDLLDRVLGCWGQFCHWDFVGMNPLFKFAKAALFPSTAENALPFIKLLLDSTRGLPLLFWAAH